MSERPWLHQPLFELSFVVLDLEATGLDAHRDRVVEIAVVEAEAGQEPRVRLDTLVDPGRAMAATEIHGLTDWDVAGAPSFEAVAPALLHALDGRLLVAHNADLDLRLLGAELAHCGRLRAVPPHLCSLRLARSLGHASSYELGALCRDLGVPYQGAHAARNDARATARLLRRLLDGLSRLGIDTLAALRERTSGLESLDHEPWPAPPPLDDAPPLRPRQGVGHNYEGHLALRRYRDEVLGAVHDLGITDAELTRIRSLRAELDLSEGQVLAMHARVLSEYIGRFIDDDVLDPEEIEGLHRLSSCLATLGWAPGQPRP
ncbi:MAG: 3'-5' exonuclease [Myxococcales bacterium]|nr:3'-5' exonuclease [Myxococcales bacterium]